MNKKILLSIVAFLSIITISFSQDVSATTGTGGVGYTFTQTFEDPILAEEVAKASGANVDDIITTTHLENAYSVRVDGKDISSIKGIEYFEYTVIFAVTNSNITTIPDVSNMTSLRQLILSNNRITSIDQNLMSFLPTDIQVLDLAGNHISVLPKKVIDDYVARGNFRVLEMRNQIIHSSVQTVYTKDFSFQNLASYNDNQFPDVDTISNGGVYSNNYITWSNIELGTHVLSYNFNQNIANTINFGGSVTLPVKVLEKEVVVTPEKKVTNTNTNKSLPNTGTIVLFLALVASIAAIVIGIIVIILRRNKNKNL